MSACLKDAERGPVVVTRNGRAVAVLLPAGDDEELERLVLVYSPNRRAILDAGRERIRRGSGIRHEDFWREVNAGGEGKAKGAGRRKSA